ncbi:hypothetical protein OG943_30285 [Amycolatopsis sp. NBC_00345]|uniref:hypothetical protein n=1 Tax=Amycolatopsis sp. NBC_00345 TaxID=2975955 RepID=UPI00324B60A3
MAGLIATARAKGVSSYVGDGARHWPAVRRLDLARVFRLAVEKAPAGSVLHGIAEEGVAMRGIAEVIGRHLDVPVTSVPPEPQPEHPTWQAAYATFDMVVSSALTRELPGWQPIHPGLLEDLGQGHYFAAPVTA